MTTVATFALLREGPSDDGLVPHLRTLLVRAGLSEAVGDGREYKGSVADKFRQLLAEESSVDVAFVHRDADGRESEARHLEIEDGAREAGYTGARVPVIPVQELEAWLLVSELEIRRVVGRPSGRRPLNLPRVQHIESHADPKRTLRDACLEASEATGRRREKERKAFAQRRRTLLERLDIDGAVRSLDSWRALEENVALVAQRLLGARQS